MPGKATRLFVGLFAAMAALGVAVNAEAQEKKIKIGVIYDLTGPTTRSAPPPTPP
jgi:branched-chain amino acid transport system substrate-binding protein